MEVWIGFIVEVIGGSYKTKIVRRIARATTVSYNINNYIFFLVKNSSTEFDRNIILAQNGIFE